MSRPPREFIAGAIYHVFSRGSNRQAIFAFDSDRLDFLECLGRVVRMHEIRCLGYCLMPNHYHLVLQPRGELSRPMKALNGRYSLRFNRRHDRDAHLFKNRFGAVLQETSDQLLWTLRYMVRNPVDAGLCSQPEEWPWSSYRASTGLDQAPPFLDLPGLLSYFADSPGVAMARYRALVTDSDAALGV